MGEFTPLTLENATSQGLTYSSVDHPDLMKVMGKILIMQTMFKSELKVRSPYILNNNTKLKKQSSDIWKIIVFQQNGSQNL